MICTVGGLIPGAVFGFGAPGRLTSIGGAAFRAGGADCGDDPTIGSDGGAPFGAVTSVSSELVPFIDRTPVLLINRLR
ncbi:MAG TPA: hypothetical protein VKB86_20150 [Pyrinomonadaceae bacterium]|nr:hypothetical protein [Pyrinomonadaceae bacterium]